MVKNLPANVGDARDMGSIPGSGRSPGGGNGNPVFLPGKFHGQRSLAGCSPWGRKELDTTEHVCEHIPHQFSSVQLLSRVRLFATP